MPRIRIAAQAQWRVLHMAERTPIQLHKIGQITPNPRFTAMRKGMRTGAKTKKG